MTITVVLKQDGIGTRTVTWPTNTRWPGGSPPTLTVTPGSIDVITLTTIDSGITWLGFASGQDIR